MDERSRTSELDTFPLLYALDAPVFLTSNQGRIIDWNHAATDWFSGAGVLVGRSIRELLPFLPADSYRRTRPSHCEGRITARSGHEVHVKVYSATFFTEKRLAKHILIVHDVTRLIDISDWREQIVHFMAHEMRGPLGVLENLIGALREDDMAMETRQRLLLAGFRTIKRTQRLLDNLMTMGSIRAGRFVVDPQPVLLSDLFSSALEAVESDVGARDQRIAVFLPADSPRVLADFDYMTSVLVNLLSNASKYSPAGANIRLSASEWPRGTVRIAVQDQGPGIAPEDRGRVFDRFYRVRSQHQPGGMGLGLAIVKEVVEAHNGSIDLSSELGHGTVVSFTVRAA